MTPARVLHIAGGMDRAGVETLIMNLYRRVDRSRLQFDFLYFTQKHCDFDDEIEAMGGIIYRLPVPRHPLDRFFSTLSFLRKQPTFRAVHVHELFDGGIYLLAARIAGIAIRIAHAHATSANLTLSFWGSQYQRLTMWLTSLAATRKVACGQAAGRFLFGDSNPFLLLPNAIDLSRFQGDKAAARDRLKELLHLGGGSTILCQIGRLDHQKNPLFTLQIAETLHLRGINFHLLFVGDGKLRESLETYVKEKGLFARVSFAGIRSDVAQIMMGADALLLPSRYEGFPLVLVEAQAAGLPAYVSTEVSREVDLGVNTITFLDMNAPQQWAAQVEQLHHGQVLSRREIHDRIRKAGYDAAESAEKLTAVYRLQH